MIDRLANSPWSSPETVAGFVQSPPNEVLRQFAEARLRDVPQGRALDVGCGAARNAVPLAELGWDVVGVDLSWPMLAAAATRAGEADVAGRLRLALAPMDRLPIADRRMDFIIAHGIWNLAQSSAEFRRAVAEAARVARPDAALFVFTFSRHTLPAETTPVPGEPFVFTEFSGQPQCFLTEAQLVAELGAAGFVPDPRVPLTEYNRREPGTIRAGTPVIYEAAFRRAT
jgi:SAM-dependent methyltransferase